MDWEAVDCGENGIAGPGAVHSIGDVGAGATTVVTQHRDETVNENTAAVC